MKRSTFITAVAAVSMGLATLSTMASARGGPGFDALDADGNGEITQEEMRAAADARFKTVDRDGDGFLSQSELAARGEERAAARAERMLERADADRDGKLSRDEMRAGRDPSRLFDRMDKDDSGTISKAEFDAARDRFRERRNDG